MLKPNFGDYIVGQKIDSYPDNVLVLYRYNSNGEDQISDEPGRIFFNVGQLLNSCNSLGIKRIYRTNEMEDFNIRNEYVEPMDLDLIPQLEQGGLEVIVYSNIII